MPAGVRSTGGSDPCGMKDCRYKGKIDLPEENSKARLRRGGEMSERMDDGCANRSLSFEHP
jgi:hypothetical protein